MNRRPLYFVIPALAVAALGYRSWPSSGKAPGHAAAHAAAPVAAAVSAGRAAGAPSQRAERSRYRLSSEHRATVDGKELASVVVEGTWTTTERTEGHVEIQLAATRVEAAGEAPPSAEDLGRPFVLATLDGLLTRLSFPAETPSAARGMLTDLATLFQVTSRPGDAWTVEEEDLTGRYLASYTRAGARVTRTRVRYTALRGAGGLSADRAGSVVPEEHTELVFDDRGLVSVTVRLGQTYAMRKGAQVVKTSVVASLRREDTEQVARAAALDLDLQPIRSYTDREGARRSRNEALLGGAKAPALIAEAREAAHLDRNEESSGKRRAAARHRLSALVQNEPEAADALARAIRSAPRDLDAVRLIAGSLASTDSPAATNALASLLNDPLPTDAQTSVLSSLALARTPTVDSAAALARALDAPLGDQAALALGAQARGLGDDGADAIDLLLERYANAATPSDKRMYLLSLANTGSRKVLDVLREAITGPDFTLASAATRGLRLIPGGDVDDLLFALIQSGSVVIFDAIQAVGYRSPALWRPRLLTLRTRFQTEKRVVDAIGAVLVRWENLDRVGQD